MFIIKKVRRVFSLLMICLMWLLLFISFVACSDASTEDANKADWEERLVEWDVCDYFWENMGSSIDPQLIHMGTNPEPITSSNQAFELADYISENIAPFRQKLAGILHYTDVNIWVFEFSLNLPETPIEELVEGGCTVYVIDGNTGFLIGGWAGE